MFDDFGQLRILPASEYEDSDKIRDLTLEFNSSFNTFNTEMKNLLNSLSDKSLVIQHAQLEALGYLIQLDSLQEKRLKADAQESAILREKKAESSR